MLPAALATGIGSDVQRGLGIVIVGGLHYDDATHHFHASYLLFCLGTSCSTARKRCQGQGGHKLADG
jgi:hypothetical protein